MKRSFLQNSARRTAFVLAMLLLLGSTPVQAAGNTTACKSQQASMESRVCPLLLPPGRSVTLSAEYLEMRLGLPAGEIAAITITSLPKQSGGRLMLDGVEVQMYDTILRSELDRLCYVQDDSAQQAGAGWFSFIPLCKESTKICATFQIGQQPDTAQRPLVQDVFCCTSGQTPVFAALSCLQGKVVYTVQRKPAKGSVCFADGKCVYTPNEGAQGTDRFVLTALDEQGGVSAPIEVQVMIRSEG